MNGCFQLDVHIPYTTKTTYILRGARIMRTTQLGGRLLIFYCYSAEARLFHRSTPLFQLRLTIRGRKVKGRGEEKDIRKDARIVLV